MSGDNPRAYSWRTLILCSLSAIAAFASVNWLVYRHSAYFQRERRYWAQVDAVADHPDAKIIFAGDSHVAAPMSYFDDYLPDAAYSAAIGGDSLRECFAKLRYVLERPNTVNLAVISADPHMFAKGRLESANRSFADRYFLAAGDRSGLKRGMLSAMLNQVPLFNDDYAQYLRKFMISQFSHKTRTSQPAQPEPLWYEEPPSERSQEARDTGLMDQIGAGQYREPFDWYRRILALAKAHRVEVIGIRFPVAKEYQDGVSSDRVAAIDAFLKANGIGQIVDLREALSDPRDFVDPDHVSELGARKILRILGDRINRPLLPASG